MQEADISVEVFVLVYNDGKVAKNAIESVLSQTHKNLRLTILENGSSDDTRSVVEQYALNRRVKIIRNESNIRSGLATPYMLKSDAEWVSILFADDYYAEDRIAKMIAAAGDSAAVFSNNYYVDEGGAEIEPPEYISSVRDVSLCTTNEHLRKMFICGNSLHPCAMLIRTNVYRVLGGFPVYLHRLGDMYLFAKLLANYPVKLMAERLQYITVWADMRNESAANRRNPMPTALESWNFRELYSTPPILNRIERIFSSHLEGVKLETEAERLWYLGRITLRDCGVYGREFGFRCLYRAIELDEPRISQLTLATTGLSAGVYVGELTEQHGPYQAPGQSIYGPITLRAYARQFKTLVFLWMMLYRRPKLLLSSLTRKKESYSPMDPRH